MARAQIIQSFVARVWLERTDDDHPEWRGHIQHIQGPEEIYFQNLSEMAEFLEQVSGIAGPGFGTHGGKVVSISKYSQQDDSQSETDEDSNDS